MANTVPFYLSHYAHVKASKCIPTTDVPTDREGDIHRLPFMESVVLGALLGKNVSVNGSGRFSAS